MTKAIPTIQKYMTTTPQTLGGEQNLLKAKSLMSDLNIRHLPVLHGGQLVGIVSDRDLKLVESFKDVDPAQVTLKEIMISDPYTVSPDASLEEVANTMAEFKYGAAVVVQNQQVVGIFTAIDALKALAELLETRLKK